VQKNPLTFHASLYGVAEKYECPDLKELCRNAYIRSLSGQFSTSDFISSIHVVYETTPETDEGLRKWAVIVSQGYKSRLQLHPSFKALFTSRPDFSWELTTAYTEVKNYYCGNCEKNVPCGKTGCICSHSSVSGQINPRDSQQDGMIWCPHCRTLSMSKLCGLGPVSENPRWNFKDVTLDNALAREVQLMDG
jgi:hypothetical protein